jgi:hypothetical protein
VSRTLLASLALVGVVSAGHPAQAGHEVPFYPSFYPQEIKVEVMEPPAAARLLQKKTLHAYLGADPFAGGAVPPHVTYAESLKSYLVLTFDRPGASDAAARCPAAAKALKRLSGARAGFTFHPYPVTPYHDDYLQHVDLVESVRRAMAQAPEAGAPPRIRARGALAERVLAGNGRGVDTAWDATLEEIDVQDLLADRETRLNGWLGPPWLKQGWFQTYLLNGGTLTDETARRTVEETLARRVGNPLGLVERVNLERKLVTTLTRGCERVVIGYASRREALNVEYSEGIENIAYDAQSGLGSAIFLRDVKLKDFPWNGWLHLGSQPRPTTAWNPFAGFGDGTGRLMWLAVGDPALFPAPNSGDWVPNRVRAEPPTAGPVEIPADALVPDRATGVLRPAGRGGTAVAMVPYQVLASAFHDGTKMSPADLVSAFVFAYRWSARAGGTRYDPIVDRATALLRDRLAAIKVVRVDAQIKDYGELQLIYDIPRVEVYLRAALEPGELAVVAPPWTAVPWELTVLMEEAVTRGLAAFSEAEARRRGVAWLDLVRDRKLTDRLAALAGDFERRAFVPEALRGLVTVEQARQRWAALRRFHRQHGHLLISNGPYQLEKWTPDAVVLKVFRDFSYPLPMGVYDQYALPLRAFVTRAEQRGERLDVWADVEKVSKFERSYKIEREPFRPAPAGEAKRDALVARYVVLDAGDHVVSVGASAELDGERLVVDLRGQLSPGVYRVALALALNGNFVSPEVKVLPYRVGN